MSCVQNDIVFLKKDLEDHLLNTHRLLLCTRWSNQFRPLKLDVSDFKMYSLQLRYAFKEEMKFVSNVYL